MANLSKGSTVGGFAIVSEEDSNEHIHSVDDIDGLGSAATAETGPGSGFDADSLNGLHYSDIENNLVNISGDTIVSNISLTDPIDTSNDLSAITRDYVDDYLQDNVIISDDMIPFVSISDSSTLSYNESNDTVSLSAGDILIGGVFYEFTTLSRILLPESNATKYIYVTVTNNSLQLEIEDNPIEHDYTKILIGTVSFTAGLNLDSVIQRQSMTNLGNYSISYNAMRDSIMLSNSSGDIDNAWFDTNFTDTVDTVSVQGDITVSSGSASNYLITDYDQFSSYNVSVQNGSITYSGDTITFNAPIVSQPTMVSMIVTRNSTSFTFNIEVLP